MSPADDFTIGRPASLPDAAELPVAKRGPLRLSALKRVAVGFAGPDPQGVIDRRHEDLAVADLAGAGARGNDPDRLVGEVGRDSDLDPELRQEVHDIFGAAVDFGVTLLAAVALDLGYRHAMDADRRQCLAHLVQLEWFDNGNNEFHVRPLFPKFRTSVAPWVGAGPTLAFFYANGTKTCRCGRRKPCLSLYGHG